MISATGSCSGIENYSRHLSGRKEGQPPPTLFEYLPTDSLIFVDESHVTIPQIKGMFKGDRSRKETLSEHGFRLPSCKDNRPLMFEEWEKFKGQTIYVSATFAGSITAILINTPGTSAAAATTFDGFPLAQRGEAGRALGIAVIASTFGGIVSVVVLCFAAPLLARVAYEFRPPEYFALTIFGLSMLASISAGGAVKNLIGGVFGVWLSTIGAERVTAIERFMFGNYELYEGLSFVPVMIGLFAISELLVQSKHAHRVADMVTLKAVKLPTREDYRKIWKTIARSSGIGTFIGILPAEGATVASMIGYSEARRWSKNREEFGKGSVEGIAGAEAANNAATGGAMVPTMVLGIPGSGTTAIILVGLMVHGLRPGPYLFTEQIGTVYQIFGSMLVANVIFLAMGLYAAKLFARISQRARSAR